LARGLCVLVSHDAKETNMSNPVNPTLIRLGDTTLIPAEPSQDIRGRKVVDSNGEDVGDVSDLFVDEIQKIVRFIEVANGGLMGIGRKRFLVPVDAVTRVDKWTVRIDRHRDHVKSSPPYQPELIDLAYLDQIYQHYGVPPFWSAGYTYPLFPYY
jgi:sporulation protein YlmC with PRC-barrel domain